MFHDKILRFCFTKFSRHSSKNLSKSYAHKRQYKFEEKKVTIDTLTTKEHFVKWIVLVSIIPYSELIVQPGDC